MLSGREFFEELAKGRLVGLRCRKCHEGTVPPRAFCVACGARDWESMLLSGDGTIASFTVIRVAPRAMAADAPYALAVVKMKEGVSLLGRVVDLPVDKLAIGTPVRFRKITVKDHVAIGFGPA